MDESQKPNVEKKNSITKEYIGYDYIYMNFQSS